MTRQGDSGDLHEVSVEIGGLKKAVEMMMAMWERQEEAATAGRKALHEKVEMVRQELGVQVAGLSLRVDRLSDHFATVEPSVNSLQTSVKVFEDEKLRREGEKRLGKFLIAALTTTAGLIGAGVHELIGYLKH